MTNVSFSGTAAEFAEKNVRINGVVVDSVGLSNMAKYGFVKITGKAQKEPNKRGRAGSIYCVESSDLIKVEADV